MQKLTVQDLRNIRGGVSTKKKTPPKKKKIK
jgi:hypothetical protein